MKRLMTKELVFYLGVGLFFTHELDAMPNHEWRVLPLTSWLPDDFGRNIFVLIHIPLFAVLVGLIASQNEAIRNRAKFWVSAFLVIHGVLHAAFMIHERYEFDSLLSNVLIFGGALCGIVYLVSNQISARNVT